jgi:hypothetical protein
VGDEAVIENSLKKEINYIPSLWLRMAKTDTWQTPIKS